MGPEGYCASVDLNPGVDTLEPDLLLDRVWHSLDDVVPVALELEVDHGRARLRHSSAAGASRRHEGPLRKLFDLLLTRGRNGAAATIEPCVLVIPSSIIHRPAVKAFDTTNVIWADQFRAWHEDSGAELDRHERRESALEHPQRGDGGRVRKEVGPPASPGRSAGVARLHAATGRASCAKPAASAHRSACRVVLPRRGLPPRLSRKRRSANSPVPRAAPRSVSLRGSSAGTTRLGSAGSNTAESTRRRFPSLARPQ